MDFIDASLLGLTDPRTAGKQEGTYPGTMLLQRIFQKPFISNPLSQHVLQEMTDLMFETEIDIIQEKLNENPKDSHIQDSVKSQQYYEMRAEELAEEYYFDDNDDLLDEIDDTLQQISEHKIEISKQSEEIENESVQETQSMMLNKTESLVDNLESLADKIKWKKGGLPEAAVQRILNSFNVCNVSQVYINGRQADIMTWINTSPKFKVLHEVKCVDQLSKHDLEQFGSYLDRLKGGNSIICYHFMRLLKHKLCGFNNWLTGLLGQLSNLAQDKSVAVFCLFYEKPLLSAQNSYCDGKLVPKFIISNLQELIESSKWKAINTAARNYILEDLFVDHILESVKNSTLILKLGECCNKSVKEIVSWLKDPETRCPSWIQNGSLQPLDDNSVFHTIHLLTEYLECCVVYKDRLVSHKIESIWDEKAGTTTFKSPQNPHYSGIVVEELCQFPLFQSEKIHQEHIVKVEKCPGSDNFTVENFTLPQVEKI